MQIEITVLQNYGITFQENLSGKDLEPGQPSRRREKIAAAQKVRRTGNTNKFMVIDGHLYKLH